MSCNVGDVIACPSIQDYLDGHFGEINGNFTSIGAPFLEFVRSPLNTNGALQRQIDSGNGHYRSVELLYESRDLVSAVTTSASISCSGGNQPCNDSKLYEIDPAVGAGIKWSIENAVIAKQCEGDASYFARQVQRKIDVMLRAMDKSTVATAATLIGRFASTGNTSAITIDTKNADGVYIADAVETVRYETLRNEQASNVVLFSGSQKFYNYFTQYLGSVANTAFGMDIAKMIQAKGIVPFYDINIETFGADKVLAFMPGAVQLITYNKFAGSNTFDTATIKQGTVQDMRTGLYFDYYAEYDCGIWNFQLSLAYKLVGAPTDLFTAGDPLDHFTGVNQYLIT